MNDKILIIGGFGRIGGQLVKHLLKKDHTVIVADIKKKSIKSDNFFFEKLDITDLKNIDQSLNKIFKKHINIKSVINCAYPIRKDSGKQSFRYKPLPKPT